MGIVRILLAGRDPASLEIIKKMLKFHNRAYEVDFATDGAACVQKTTERRYDLLLLDNDLPDRDGLQVLRELKAANVEVPIILMVEDGQNDVALAAMDAGAQDYVMKVRGYLTALPFTVLKAIEGKKRAQEPERERREVQTPKAGKECIFVLDKRGRFLSADPKIHQILGYSEEELLELSIADLLNRGHEAEFYRWLHSLEGEAASLRTELVSKTGARKFVELKLTPILDDAGANAGYRGRLVDISSEVGVGIMQFRVDQHRLFREIVRAVEDCAGQPVQVLLQRLAEVAAQQFGFLRATVALLDQRRRAFVKQALVGYREEELAGKAMEVPKDLVDRIFEERFRIKVIYNDQEFVKHPRILPGGVPERRTQVRRPKDKWSPQDLILVSLSDSKGRTFGFISLEQTVNGYVPTRDTFHNLEIFGILASHAVEEVFRREAQDRRYRRVKQFLASNTLFHLDSPFNRALYEFAWLIRYLSDFDLVLVGIISRQTERFEFRAAACADSVKAHQLKGLHWSLSELRFLLKQKYQFGKSYLISNEEEPLRILKRIYYGGEQTWAAGREWSYWHTLLVPIRTREKKIVGALVLDDPGRGQLPVREAVHLLELMAAQVGLAIENRLFLLKKEQVLGPVRQPPARGREQPFEEGGSGLRRLVEKFLR